VEVSTNANEAAFRDLTMAITMALDLGSGSLNQAAFENCGQGCSRLHGGAASRAYCRAPGHGGKVIADSTRG
jgi:hypothetical protein